MSEKEQNQVNKDLTETVNKLNLGAKKSFESFLIRANGVEYECIDRTGKGSFGTVYKAIQKDINNNQKTVAIKKVLQDPNYKNRELQIMKLVKHPNTVELLDSFYQKEKSDVFLHLILGYMPETLSEVSSIYAKKNQQMPLKHVQSYIWQLCRALSYIHSLGICHRDIKPQNLLINSQTLQLRLCDFGSAKILVAREQNVAYICSRYYRAPELIFGAIFYTTAIDIWSTGCVFAELILGTPLFAGESGVDQLVEIIKVLGTPTRKQIHRMNPDYRDYNKFPLIKRHPWEKLFPSDTPSHVLDLIAKMLRYTPTHRILPLESLCHPFFDSLRQEHNIPSSPNISIYFDFSTEELETARNLGVIHNLFPPEELQKLSGRFDMNKPIKPSRTIHQTSSSSSKEEIPSSDDDDDA
jgi:glycogen synthase kinase 3 beta